MGHRSEVRGFYHRVTTPADPSTLLLLLLLEGRNSKIVLEIMCTEEGEVYHLLGSNEEERHWKKRL